MVAKEEKAWSKFFVDEVVAAAAVAVGEAADESYAA